jgi:hypothetical protein
MSTEGGKICWTSGSSQLENSGNAWVPPHRQIDAC